MNSYRNIDLLLTSRLSIHTKPHPARKVYHLLLSRQ